jgi:2'-5' RNA ligase
MVNPHERLFFALWPNDQVRQQINSAYHNFSDLKDKGRRVPLENLHMTLHFLGNIKLADVDCFIQQAGKVKASKFDLSLTCRGYFKKPKIVWFGLDNTPAKLNELHQQLGRLISACGFASEQRAYNPHITMARKINQDPGNETLKPIHWEIDRFVLVISEPVDGGVSYRVKASFPLIC